MRPMTTQHETSWGKEAAFIKIGQLMWATPAYVTAQGEELPNKLKVCDAILVEVQNDAMTITQVEEGRMISVTYYALSQMPGTYVVWANDDE